MSTSSDRNLSESTAKEDETDNYCYSVETFVEEGEGTKEQELKKKNKKKESNKDKKEDNETDNYCYSVDTFIEEEEDPTKEKELSKSKKKDKKSPQKEINPFGRSKITLRRLQEENEAKEGTYTSGYSINEDDYNIEEQDDCDDTKSYVLSEGELSLEDRVHFSYSDSEESSFEIQPLMAEEEKTELKLKIDETVCFQSF